MVEGRVLTAGIMLTFFVVVNLIALTQYEGETRLMPLVVGIPGLLLATVQFVTELRSKGGERLSPELRRATARMFGWFFAFLAGIILFGFPYAGPLLVAAYLRFSWHERWVVCLGAGAFAWAVLYGLFEHFLGLPLFEGLVVAWLFA